MTVREEREKRKQEALNKRLKRVEIAKRIVINCQKFIAAEELLLDSIGKETDKETKNKLYNSKVGAKHAMLLQFKRFNDII